MAQWLACWAHNPKVPGSKPGSAMFLLSQKWPVLLLLAVVAFVGCACWFCGAVCLLVLLCCVFVGFVGFCAFVSGDCEG